MTDGHVNQSLSESPNLWGVVSALSSQALQLKVEVSVVLYPVTLRFCVRLTAEQHQGETYARNPFIITRGEPIGCIGTLWVHGLSATVDGYRA